MTGRWRAALFAAILLLGAGAAQAHWMVAQKGTLNLVGDGAFMVMSLPVSAFQGVDDNHDGLLSATEMHAHGAQIQAQVQAGVQLIGPHGALPLQGLMMNLSPDDSATPGTASQLVVMGRFDLGADARSAPVVATRLALQVTLFGSQASEQQQDLTITRQTASQWLRLTPERPLQVLFPAASTVFAEHLRLGATHVLSGLDHLLFLLVVLAAGWTRRQLLGVLTCFTAGHALTLAACLWGGWSVPSRIVEPAIAATIMGMALFDLWHRRRSTSIPVPVRLAIVFACALIHGLGLADALTSLGVDSFHLLWGLAGFNLGIEVAQVSVALLAWALMWGLQRGMTPLTPRSPWLQPARATSCVTFVAIAAGAVWLVERLAPLA